MRRCVAHKIKVPTTKAKATIEGHMFVTYKSWVSHNPETEEKNLIKLHRNVKQKKKQCFAYKI